ncbi:MAG TPA: septum formation family protein [Nocardioidaceae bacterium]|nr:septum formation family protein [Nocardioidaceae bacterium]
MSTRRGTRRLLATTAATTVTVAAVLLQSACTGDGSPQPAQSPPQSAGSGTASAGTAADDGTTTRGGASPKALRAPPPEPPEEGACYRLTLEEASKASSDREPVPCGSRHTSVTLHVGHLRGGGTEAEGTTPPDTQAILDQVSRVCPRHLARTIGGDRSERRLSRLKAVWFTPDEEQLAAGADWFRCDAVALAGRDRLAPLPRPKRLDGLLDRGNALARWGTCGTAAPGSDRFQRVICSSRHSWQAVATLHLAGGDKYPGRRTVRRAGDDRCRDLVRSLADSSLRFRYGWEWPSRDQWQAGQHYGLCWAPSNQ